MKRYMTYKKLRHTNIQYKTHVVVITMDDLNAKKGVGRQGEVVGPFGRGERNERGDKWVEWCCT